MAAFPNIVIPNQGTIDDLDSWRPNLNAGSVRLYTNNYTPIHTSVPANFTEATFVGYAPVSPPGFAAAFLNGFGQAETDSGVITFTFTAGVGTVTVYGWFLTNLAGTKVLAATKFLVPIVLTPVAPSLSRVIQLTAESIL